MSAAVWIFVSTFTRRIDQRRRLRLPAPWRVEAVQHWLLYPGDLMADAPSEARTLCLTPDRPRARATATDALRAVALRRGLDPTIVTHHRTDAATIHLTLSSAQLNWLRTKNRSFVLSGQLTTIQIRSAEEHWCDPCLPSVATTPRFPRNTMHGRD